jgi:hypothetical protein
MEQVGISQLIGSWKSEPYENRGKTIEMFLDISEKKICFTGTMGGVEQPKMEFGYNLKNVVDSEIIIESIIPEANNRVVEFKFKIEGEKVLFTDPDQKIITLSRNK